MISRTQLKSFKQRLEEAGDKEKRIPANWFEAFSRLEKVLSAEETKRSVHGKKIVFFDEFPWFATARSDFLVVDHKKRFRRFRKPVWQSYKPNISAPVFTQGNRNVYAGQRVWVVAKTNSRMSDGIWRVAIFF